MLLILKCHRRCGVALRIGLMLAFTALGAVSASAQGCALCYTQAAASGSRMIRALWAGIGILVFPPMVLSVFLTVLTYRKRSRFRCADPEVIHASSDSPPNPSRHLNVQSSSFAKVTHT